MFVAHHSKTTERFLMELGTEIDHTVESTFKAINRVMLVELRAIGSALQVIEKKIILFKNVSYLLRLQITPFILKTDAKLLQA